MDVGCCPGIDAAYISSKGFNVTGIDLSRTMPRLAKQNAPKARFKVADMRKLQFNQESFDGIFVAYSLIHIQKKDALHTLTKLCKICKTKAALYVAVRQGRSKEFFIKEPLQPSEKMFLNIFLKYGILSLIKKSGFKIARIYERKANNKNEVNFNKFFVLAKK